MRKFFDDELIVDSFCGGGGASEGIRMATGRDPDVAINHDPEAVAMHQANHPNTRHYCKSIYKVDPDDIIREYRKRIGLAWFSPDCTHHSKARGGRPKQKHIRDLAWVVVHWAERAVWQGQRIRQIYIENVEEFQDWGPLLEDGTACPVQKGAEFKRWVAALRRLGYKVEWRELRACDYGAPTIRKRLFVIARCDKEPIVWPEPTHGPGRKFPYRTAAECIDFRNAGHSIFLTKEEGRAVRAQRPLAPATMRRTAHGVDRFVLKAREPFLVNLTHQGGERIEPTSEPFRVITGAHRGEKALLTPFITEHANASRPRSYPADSPMRTQCAQVKGGHFALVAPQIIRTAHGDVDKNGKRRGKGQHAADFPLGSVLASSDYAVANAILAPSIITYYGDKKPDGDGRGSDMQAPLHTQPTENRHGLICPVLVGLGGRAGQSRPRSGDEATATITAKADTAICAVYIQRFNQNGFGQECGEALDTVMAQAPRFAICSAFLAQHNNHNGDGVNPGRPATDPASTITANGSQQGLISAMLMQFNGQSIGVELTQPNPTVMGREKHSLVAASLVKLRGTCAHGQPVDDPACTISAQGTHVGLNSAFLMAYYGQQQAPDLHDPSPTVTSRDRFGLGVADMQPEPLTELQLDRARKVAALLREHGLWDDREFVTMEVYGLTFIIVDIYMRMLTRRELFLAQGFREDYIIAPEFNGKPMTNTASVRMCGNSVSPPPACAIITANNFQPEYVMEAA